MIPGRIFFRDDEVFTDWFPRGGDGIIVRGEAIDTNNTSIDLKVEPDTKSEDTTGVGTKIDAAGSSWDLAIDGNQRGKVLEVIKVSTSSVGMRELVRFRLSVINASAATDWISIRLFPPIFFDAAT
jgi:hypothetical protein